MEANWKIVGALGWTLAIVLMVRPSLAQEHAVEPDPAKVEAMEKIDMLAGEWKGEGWMSMGPGGRREFRGQETVRMRLGGTVMVIEGKHWSKEEGNPLVHHAMAVISPRPEGDYEFRTWLTNREGGTFEGRFEEDAFIWSMETPRGRMRYVIRVDDQGRWSEVGEWQDEDGTWNQFFEMTLEKQ